jgi:TolB-like protein
MIKNIIQTKFNEIFKQITQQELEITFEEFKRIKASLSGKILAQRLSITEAMLTEFEEASKQYFLFRDEQLKSRLACFRVSLWLETICKNLNISFSLDESISNEELAIKQVRALELIIRDVVNENLGGKEHVLSKLQELFKQDVVDKWLKSADDTGVLSGTTFSELSNIFLDKNIFKSVEEIFETSQLKLSKTGRESLRYILEDIRLIRNAIAHNKKVTHIQIEALNEYYRNIAQLIKDSKSNNINPDNYLDLGLADIDSFLNTLKEDNKLISTGVEEIRKEVKDIKENTQVVRKRTTLIITGIVLTLVATGAILYFVSKQSGTTDDISKDIKDVKNIVSGDAELKNMSSTDDLTATKDLNKRTKDVNAKRLAIIYFDNSGGEASMDKLKKGLADMLITDLSNVRMLDIVERDKLEAILKEQKLSNSKDFDPSTAAKVGKLLGAQVILTGGYFDMMGSMRIDARFIDVETGKILKSDGVDGATSSFFKIQKQLAWKIINNMDVKISDEEKKELESKEKSKALSIEDLTEYSKALELYDKGKKDDAKKIAEKIANKYPDFEPMKNLLKKLKQ